MSKIAPDLLAVLQQRELAHAQAVERGDPHALAWRDAPIDVQVFFVGEADALVADGFPIGGHVANVAQGGLSPDQIRQLALVDKVSLIELPPVHFVTLDRSVPDILGQDAWAEGVPPDTVDHGKGAGVVVGVIDSGFDVFHGAFRNPDGSSRILRLWDQTFNYVAGVPADSLGTPITGDLQPRDETGAVLTPARAPTDLRVAADSSRPQLFTNGAQFNTAQINAALAAHPDGKNLPISLRDQPVGSGSDTTFHGTHVAGIAAGNGAQNDGCTSAFTYVGVAPKADLVLVKTSVGGGTPNRLSNLVDAAEFIFRVAARQNAPTGKPCVINISLGAHGTPHNGQSAESRAFDTLTTGPLGIGRSIVIAASNDRNDDLHAAFALPHNTSRTVRVNLLADVPRLVLFCSFNPAARLTCLVRAPGPAPAQQAPALPTHAVNNNTVPIGTSGNGVVVSAYSAAPADPDSHFRVTISRPNGNLPKGPWEFDIAASNAAADANVHVWIASPSGKSAAILPFPGAVPSVQDVNRAVKRPADWIASTLSSLASTRSAITVAAYDAEESGGPLAYFSSQGPGPNHLALGLFGGPDAIAKPDIAAPGMNIDAPRGEARKCCLECNCCVDRYVSEQGTSMAAPHIAGVIALMYARDPTLTPDGIKAILRNTQRNPPALPPGWPPAADLWGAGKVDAKAAVHVLVPRVMAPDAAPAPMDAPRPRMQPVAWPERLRAWSGALDPHPSWNLCAALVSQHYDEVKRLIDTNRRVAAVWQRHGGPALVRGLFFAQQLPDPPIPAGLAGAEPSALVPRLLRVLLRFGGEALRADIARHAPLVLALPGSRWDELDALIGGGP